MLMLMMFIMHMHMHMPMPMFRGFRRKKGTDLFTLWPVQRCVLSLTSPTGTLCYFRLRVAIESPETTKVNPRPESAKAVKSQIAESLCVAYVDAVGNGVGEFKG